MAINAQQAVQHYYLAHVWQAVQLYHEDMTCLIEKECGIEQSACSTMNGASMQFLLSLTLWLSSVACFSQQPCFKFIESLSSHAGCSALPLAITSIIKMEGADIHWHHLGDDSPIFMQLLQTSGS